MALTLRVCAFLVAAIVLFAIPVSPAHATGAATFSKTADEATSTLLDVLYAGGGLWRDCNKADCHTTNSDWGADSATYTLYLRWTATHDPRIRNVMAELLDAAPRYPQPCANGPCPAWSDTPSWDAVTLIREAEVLGDDPRAVALAKSALNYVEQSQAFARGACPEIPFQQARPSDKRVKTIETDANVIKAELLIYDATRDRGYLDSAVRHYATARKYYLDPSAGMYTVHVIDDGASCTQVARRFFASVNGDMIWNSLHLWRITGDRSYYDEAITTATAVDRSLSDQRGVFANLQGENDVVEPLVEAMYDLASNEHVLFAREWILRNASAALSARAEDGTFSRYFDGPSQNFASIWESNGGLALQIAAAALDPGASVPEIDAWDGAKPIGDPITTLPAIVSFTGSGIALIGTIGEQLQTAHIRVFIDGVETFDRTGLWQNASMPGGESVFFAWRWPEPGNHTIRLESGDPAIGANDVLHLQSVVLPPAGLGSNGQDDANARGL